MQSISFFDKDVATSVSSFASSVVSSPTDLFCSITNEEHKCPGFLRSPPIHISTHILAAKNILWILGWRDKAYC